MVKKQKPTPKKKSTKELDSVFFLKLVMYFIFGSMWLHVSTSSWTLPLPIGLAVGIGFATHDHFQIDRKIELAVLLVSALLFYFMSPRLIVQF
jgi:hypothetical protein